MPNYIIFTGQANNMIRSLLFTLYCLILFQPIYSQDICGQNRYLEETFSNVDFTSGILFGNANPYGIVNSQNLRLDIYEPEGDTLAKRPLVIHAFGGGFLIGWRSEPDIPNWGNQYAKRGYAFVSIDYRLGFTVSSQNSAIRAAYRAAQDMHAALRFLKDNADTYRLDMDNVFLTGSSAGCFAALILAFMEEADRPAATYGTTLEPSDLGCFFCSGNNNNNNERVDIHAVINNWGAMLDTGFIDIAANPLDNVPVISFHGTNDLIVPYIDGYPFNLPVFPVVHGSKLIHERLDNQGIYNQLYPLFGLDHEPELLYPWVTDTIVGEASRFLYPLMQPPTSDIFGSTGACVGDTVSYSVDFRDKSEYCWSASGGTIVSNYGNEVVIVWNTVGNLEISVTEYNYIHAKTTKTLEVITDLPPNTNFNFTSNNGLFNFQNNGNPNHTFTWNFGDGTTIISQNPTYQYADTGTFEVTLTVNTGICTQSTAQIIVSDICPVANFVVNQSNGVVEIENLAQFYNDIEWNFGNNTTSSAQSPTPIFEEDGAYTIQLIVSNNFCNDTLEKTVDVRNCALADFDFTVNGLEIQLINESVNSILNFWNINGVNLSSPSPSFTFEEPGNYQVNLLVYNQYNCADSISRIITITGNDFTNIFDVANDFDALIYPNPASKNIYIDLDVNVLKDIEINIWDAAGKKILRSIYQNKIDIQHFINGVYFIQITSNLGVYNSKFIKK